MLKINYICIFCLYAHFAFLLARALYMAWRVYIGAMSQEPRITKKESGGKIAHWLWLSFFPMLRLKAKENTDKPARDVPA